MLLLETQKVCYWGNVYSKDKIQTGEYNMVSTIHIHWKKILKILSIRSSETEKNLWSTRYIYTKIVSGPQEF